MAEYFFLFLQTKKLHNGTFSDCAGSFFLSAVHIFTNCKIKQERNSQVLKCYVIIIFVGYIPTFTKSKATKSRIFIIIICKTHAHLQILSIDLFTNQKKTVHKEPYLTFNKESGIVKSSIFIVQTVNPQLIGAGETDQR